MRSQPSWASLGAALLACAACGGGGSPGAPPAKLLDAVWCDIQAIPCIAIVDPQNGLPASCGVPGNTPVPASVPGGDRTCFDSASLSPEAACAQLCTSQHLSAVLFPQASPATCSAVVNTDATLHENLDAQGFRPAACTGETNGNLGLLSGAGTNTAAVSGTGTASLGGIMQPVVVHSGRFNFAAPDTSCSSLQTGCEVQINQIELAFDDFSVAGLEMQGFTLFLDGSSLTPSGTFQAGQPSLPDASFSFALTQSTRFDAIGAIRLNGASLPGFSMGSATEEIATLDLTTGAIGLPFSVVSTLDGQPFQLSGVVTANALLDQAPIVTPPAALSLDEGAACSVATTLTATASSPVGLPVTLTYAVDDGVPALDGPTAAATIYGLGSHSITIFASDTLGATSRITQTATVTGSSPCQ